MKESSFKTSTQQKLAVAIVFVFISLAIAAHLGLGTSAHQKVDFSKARLVPSAIHWLGTDQLGRDVFHRIIQATKSSVTVAFIAAALATTLSLLFGIWSNFDKKGFSPFVTILESLIVNTPFVLLVVALKEVMPQNHLSMGLALGSLTWMTGFRWIHSATHKILQTQYVEAAQFMGANRMRIFSKHLMPNLIPIVFIQFGITFALAIKYEAVLSFLGLGPDPGSFVSWGTMLQDGRHEILAGIWWPTVSSGACLTLIVLCVYTLVDAARKKTNSQL